MKKLTKNIAILLLSSVSTYVYAENDKVDWNQFFIGHSWLSDTAGVLYFAQDLKDDPFKMCKDIKENPNRISMIDQESPSIHRLQIKDSIPPSYNTDLSIEEFKKITDKSAKTLHDYCVKVNLAPVADAQKGKRIYSTNKEKNQEYINIFAQSMRENKVVPTYKHFPGLNQVKSVYDTPYKIYYKNIYGEGIVDSSTITEIEEASTIFNSDFPDVLMFSIATYNKISNKPIIYNDDIWELAYQRQPNSLYIPDDLSELIITDKELVFLFKKFDLLMFTSPNDVFKSIEVLEKAYKNGEITKEDINYKSQRMNNWKLKNNL